MAISNGNSNGSSSFTNPRGGVGFDMAGITPAPVSLDNLIFRKALTFRSLPSTKTAPSTTRLSSESDLGSLLSRVSRDLSFSVTPARVPSLPKRNRSMSSRPSSRLSTTPFPSLPVSLERVITLPDLRQRGQRKLVPLLVSSTRKPENQYHRGLIADFIDLTDGFDLATRLAHPRLGTSPFTRHLVYL
jgi:hypothetical protein